jgi:hypothetical protein
VAVLPDAEVQVVVLEVSVLVRGYSAGDRHTPTAAQSVPIRFSSGTMWLPVRCQHIYRRVRVSGRPTLGDGALETRIEDIAREESDQPRLPSEALGLAVLLA